MTVLAYLIISLAKVLGLIINLYTVVIVIGALLTWVNPDPHNQIVRLLYSLTAPAFRLVRRFLPVVVRRLPIDITPIIVLLILVIIDTVLVGTLYRTGAQMLQ